MKLNSRISIENFILLTKVFEEHQWDIPQDGDGLENRFNRFCERLSLFSNEEQKLIIDLTSRFTAINSTEYLSIILKLLNENDEINKGTINSATKLFVFPLIAPDDFEKTKSSKFVWYYLQDEKIKFHKVFLNKQLLFCEISKMQWAKNLQDNEKIILVDDYIGSGETAESAINWIVDEHGINSKDIIVISLAAQSIGLEHLKGLGIEVYTYYEFGRGISDFYDVVQCEEKNKLMNEIEKKLKVEGKYKFGYNRSEALVSLTRTPNNTFPVFWKKQGKQRIVPFPRD